MDLFKVIAEMNGEGQNFVIPRLYVKLAGGHVEALVLKQLVFWSNKTKRTDGYFYKKSEELEQETELSRRQIDRIVTKLVKEELIQTELKRANGAPTRHFKINQELIVSRLHQMVQSNAPNGAIRMHQMVQSLTDSNTDSNNSVVSQDMKRLNDEYEKRWGIAPNGVLLSFKKFVEEGFDAALLIEMMDFILKKGKRWNYAAGVLDNLEKEHGVKTLEAYHKLKGERQHGTDRKRNGGHSQAATGTRPEPRDLLAEREAKLRDSGEWKGFDDSELNF